MSDIFVVCGVGRENGGGGEGKENGGNDKTCLGLYWLRGVM
jgi:hypothetical protein